ncbi:MAG TPA: hypothetical protein VL992_07980 [Tepidisphaeraceae bacterium]|nr:hypothetical protein [Tepidisphaeraceae bacterium]
MRQIGWGFVWSIVIFMIAVALIGGFADLSAANADPQHADMAAARAGSHVLEGRHFYLFMGAAIIGFCGSFMRMLPGTGDSAMPAEQGNAE